MDLVLQQLQTKLQSWSPETGDHIRQSILELIELADLNLHVIAAIAPSARFTHHFSIPQNPCPIGQCPPNVSLLKLLQESGKAINTLLIRPIRQFLLGLLDDRRRILSDRRFNGVQFIHY